MERLEDDIPIVVGCARECFDVLRRHGLLLKSDPKLPSVTTLIAGEPVRGSWWAHPAAATIMRALEQLADHRDVLLMKLVRGKDTFVHRRFWPEIYAIATAREPWQFEQLTDDVQRLLQQLDKCGQMEATGAASKELESRLLAHGQQFHSKAGSHSKNLETWQHWAERVGLAGDNVPVSEAKRTVAGIFPGAEFPWGGDVKK